MKEVSYLTAEAKTYFWTLARYLQRYPKGSALFKLIVFEAICEFFFGITTMEGGLSLASDYPRATQG